MILFCAIAHEVNNSVVSVKIAFLIGFGRFVPTNLIYFFTFTNAKTNGRRWTRSSSVNFINCFSMKRILAFLSLVVLCCAEASAQTPQPLYPDGKFDGDNGLDSSVTADRDGVRFGVAVPDYFLFRPAPDKANGQCVVVLPGGGYGCVCYQREGIDVARWLNENGITAVVLRYRMPNGHSEIPLTDVRRMFRTVRENAAEWGIDPCQVGVMGFSAGGIWRPRL